MDRCMNINDLLSILRDPIWQSVGTLSSLLIALYPQVRKKQLAQRAIPAPSFKKNLQRTTNCT